MFSAIKCARITLARSAKFTRLQERKANNSATVTFSTDSEAVVETVDLAFSVYDEYCCLPSADDTPVPVPVIVTHGLFGNRNNWHSLAKAMNKTTKRKIFTVDLRCHGESPHHEHIDYSLLSKDVLHLMTDQLQLTKTALLGHSLGGVAVLYAAIQRPDLVECVTSVDMSLERFTRPEETGKYIDAMLAAKWDPTLTLAATRKVVDAQMKDSVQIPALRQWLLNNLVHNGNTVQWRLDLPSLRKNHRNFFKQADILGSYLGPTLYLYGANSNYVREKHHDEIRLRFPQAKFEPVPGAGHWVHSDKPQEFLEIASRFLNDVNTREH